MALKWIVKKRHKIIYYVSLSRPFSLDTSHNLRNFVSISKYHILRMRWWEGMEERKTVNFPSYLTLPTSSSWTRLLNFRPINSRPKIASSVFIIWVVKRSSVKCLSISAIGPLLTHFLQYYNEMSSQTCYSMEYLSRQQESIIQKVQKFIEKVQHISTQFNQNRTFLNSFLIVFAFGFYQHHANITHTIHWTLKKEW